MSNIYLVPISFQEEYLLKIAEERNDCMRTLRSSEMTPVSAENQRRWVESMKDSEKYYFIMSLDKCVGYCGLDKMHLVNRTAEISMLIFSEFRGFRYGSDAVEELLYKAFNIYHLNCVFGECYRTTKNWNFWNRCGFVREGTLRQRKWWNGGFYDSIMFSITREEWEQDL